MIINKAKIVLGKEGERIAELFLRKKGYKLVERNYRCAAGELDLVMLDHRVIVFVEVKTRTGIGYGTPLEAVESRKQQKMIFAAQFFISAKKLGQREARFDVVGISWAGAQPLVEHIENAFELI
ncbi:MAG TPA: YraN family protein [Candidatus Polarisedimenticolaceae bacterium]|nr:YraN family protein [Candidatus Polarisedimenticolaceae bacterium]